MEATGTHVKNIRIVSIIVGLKMQGTDKWMGYKSQGPLYFQFSTIHCHGKMKYSCKLCKHTYLYIIYIYNELPAGSICKLYIYPITRTYIMANI